LKIVLYQPDIPQNTGTILRFAACMGIEVHIIEPCGFIWNDKQLKRSVMDYIDHINLHKHISWQKFLDAKNANARLVLLTTKADQLYHQCNFAKEDYLVFGSESSGVPQQAHDTMDMRIKIPMRAGMRSYNLALSVAMTAAEALRQCDAFP
jgi:tRNA (cytidine/uridine-2'-O-)-methyltransferase